MVDPGRPDRPSRFRVNSHDRPISGPFRTYGPRRSAACFAWAGYGTVWPWAIEWRRTVCFLMLAHTGGCRCRPHWMAIVQARSGSHCLAEIGTRLFALVFADGDAREL